MSYPDEGAFSGVDIVDLLKSHFLNILKDSMFNHNNVININKFDNTLFCLNSVNISKITVFNEFWSISVKQLIEFNGISA